VPTRHHVAITGICRRWAFLINIPVGIALVVLAVTAVRESRDPDARRLDVAGMVLFGTGLACVVWALIGANAEGWASRETIAKLGSRAVLLVAFVVAEAGQGRPMVDLGLFRDRTFLGAAIAMLGFATTAQVMMTYLPLYLQNAFGKDPLHAGVAMLPFALPLFFCPRIGAYWATRIAGRSILAIGLGLVAAGNLLTAIMVDAAPRYPLVAAAMFVTGCGAGVLNSETAKVMMSVVAPERAGMASGISGTLRFVGLVAGVTGLGLALVSGTERHFAAATAQSGPALHTLVSRIVAGNITGVSAQLSETAGEASRIAIVDLARSSFAAGFTSLLLIAAGVAAIAALSSYRLLGARAAR
jgi:Na+/melibiose symporter-like transporter